MKKGVVLSVHKFSITILTPEGEFDKSRKLDRHYEIGEEISYQPIENPLTSILYYFSKKTALISAVVTCILLLSIGIPRFSTHASAYMTIDVNPSVELGLDKRLKVIELRGINADGKRVISQIPEWKNKDASDIAQKIVLKTKELGYMNGSTRKIVVSKTVIVKDEKLDKQLNQELKDFKKEMPIANTEVKLIRATENDRNKAKQQGISTGKYVVQKLIEENRNKKSDVKKKNANKAIILHRDKKQATSHKVHSQATSEKNTTSIQQHKSSIHKANGKSIKKNHKSQNVVLKRNGNRSKSKGNTGNKENSKIKNNPGNKRNSKKQSNSVNKGNSKIINSAGNSTNSMNQSISVNKDNDGYSVNKDNNGNSGNKGNNGNSVNKGNEGNKGNNGNSGNVGNSGNKGN